MLFLQKSGDISVSVRKHSDQFTIFRFQAFDDISLEKSPNLFFFRWSLRPWFPFVPRVVHVLMVFVANSGLVWLLNKIFGFLIIVGIA